MKLRNGSALLAVCLLFCSSSALALGLGDARVQSFIGQPLDMRIDLLTSPSDDLESVTARLASAEDFARIGASRDAVSMPLYFSVREGNAGAGAHILVTSRLAVSDPVLRLVVEVNWSSGRLLREYTVFLDPPTLPARAPQPATAQSARAAERAAAPVEAPAEAAAAQAAPAPEAVVPEPATGAEAEAGDEAEQASVEPPVAGETPADGGAYGPVRNGETLWRIASDHIGQSGMDMNQVMLAIQRRNPDAFMNDNINLLKRGATLEMPTADEVNEVSRERARELVAQHEAAFRMRSSLAGTSTPLLAAESRTDAVEPAPARDVSAAEEAAVSRLEIVPTSEEDLSRDQPATGAVPAGEGAEEVERELREELARAEEELFSERQQNEYLRERINELEAQLADSEGQTEAFVPDDDLATLEDRLRSERLAEAEAAEAAEAEPEAQEAAVDTPSSTPSVTTTAPPGTDPPWYSSTSVWLIMAVIVIAAFLGWLLHRRRAVEYDLSAMAGSGTVASGLRGDAEEILRTLDADRQAEEAERTGSRTPGAYPDEGTEDVTELAAERDTAGGRREADSTGESAEREVEEEPVVPLERARRYQPEDTADATVLDENSSDPEIKLDLARAYISMGDKEAARAILDEVLSIGDDAQRSEARSMMDEL